MSHVTIARDTFHALAAEMGSTATIETKFAKLVFVEGHHPKHGSLTLIKGSNARVAMGRDLTGIPTTSRLGQGSVWSASA